MKHIFRKFNYCCCIFVLLNSKCSYGEFSLKKITTWFTSEKEETYFKEIPFDVNGTIVVENETGNVLIKSWSLPKIAIEALKKAPAKDLSELSIETSLVGNQLLIKTVNANKSGSIDYQLIVPTQTNIIVKGTHCSVKTKNIKGIHQLSTQGAIDIQGACNSIQALTASSINVALASVPDQASISLKSSKSSISLTLPQTTHATIHAKTIYNSIISQHFITLKPVTVLLNKQTWNQFKKSIDGTIGSGQATIDMAAYNGILIQ